MNLAYPYRYDSRGRSAEASDAAHIRDLIEQLLFTAPGERLMRPTFGSGAAQLVFAPNSTDLAGATQMLIQAALQQWLADLIAVQAVTVEADEASLRVTVQYRILLSDQLQVQTFERVAGDSA